MALLPLEWNPRPDVRRRRRRVPRAALPPAAGTRVLHALSIARHPQAALMEQPFLDRLLADETLEPDGTLCRDLAEAVAVDELSLALIGQEGWRRTLCASSEAARTFDEWQFSLDEGPCLDAARNRAGVLVDDLGRPEGTPWPRLVEKATELGFAGVAGVPVLAGPIALGAVNLLARRPGTLDRAALRRAERLARRLAGAIVRALAEDLPGVTAPDDRDRVQLAAGMVSVQMAVAVTDALEVLRAYAWAGDHQLVDVATDVVERRLRFDREEETA